MRRKVLTEVRLVRLDLPLAEWLAERARRGRQSESAVLRLALVSLRAREDDLSMRVRRVGR